MFKWLLFSLIISFAAVAEVRGERKALATCHQALKVLLYLIIIATEVLKLPRLGAHVE